jgi:protocatechuate 3,4-dioxygenase beta subunit
MDTEPKGLTRRLLLRRAGAAGAVAVAGGALGGLLADDVFAGTNALALTPEQEEGPFYVALEKIRKNVTLGKTGVPLHLNVKVVTPAGKPVKNAACDIWQCDAVGVYSDESSENTVGQTYLRGVQLTDANGVAKFATIYPGHYQGRTTHIHIKVHIGGKVSGTTYGGGHVSHTGQILFADAITTQVYALAPYNSEAVARTYNTQDHVFTAEGGSRAMLKLTKIGSSVAAGYIGAIRLVVDPAATPANVGV